MFSWEKTLSYSKCFIVDDFELRFTYIVPNWEGLAHDEIALRNALEREVGLRVPKVFVILLILKYLISCNCVLPCKYFIGKYYLIDAWYCTLLDLSSPKSLSGMSCDDTWKTIGEKNYQIYIQVCSKLDFMIKIYVLFVHQP